MAARINATSTAAMASGIASPPDLRASGLRDNCEMLAEDHDDMVVKALSWALRVLVVHDGDRVAAFPGRHEGILAARVVREARNKPCRARPPASRGSIHRPTG